MNTLLLVVGCLSVSLVTGCNSSVMASNAVNNNPVNGAQPTKPSTPSIPGVPGKSTVCFTKACAPAISKTKIVDPRGEFKYPDPSRFPTSSQRDFYRQPIAFLDLSALNPDMRLSPDFSLRDFAVASKGRYALLSPNMVRRVQAIKDRLGAGLRVTSGFRSPGYNRKIKGSATWSRHLYGDAVDLGGKSIASIRSACTANNATFFLTYKDGHVHCDWRAVALDPALFPPSRKATANELMVQNQIALSKDTKIGFEETAAGIRLKVALPEIELEGVPVYEWVITSPSGQEQVFDTANPILTSATEKGTYFVKVMIGEFIESEATLEIE